MNIDDLKSAWKNDAPGFAHAPLNEAIYKKTTSAVTKIRSNMRNEFIGTLFTYVIMLWFLFARLQDPFLYNINCLLLFTMVLLNGYYFFRFYLFYKAIGRYDLGLKQSVSKVLYELQLNVEIYRAYNFCVTPLAIMLAIGIWFGPETANYIKSGIAQGSHVANQHLLLMLGVLFISFAVAYIMIELNIKAKYNKDVNDLKIMLNDLGEEESGLE